MASCCFLFEHGTVGRNTACAPCAEVVLWREVSSYCVLGKRRRSPHGLVRRVRAEHAKAREVLLCRKRRGAATESGAELFALAQAW